MKKYIKENQVYTVQEGSELEVQLIADDFKELVEEGGDLETPKETEDKGKK
ncbi:hypothetical protein [Streptococcus salivarius]|uniref:hypothetical protein n=1 Tax=Streptococcus salivarius TaxID=1304 RepID=UPI00321BCB7F